jgi:undecaprenyl diphosphate synthase
MSLTLPQVNGARPFAGLHVAIIMDGNGRWANGRGLPRVAGHAAGAAAVRRTVEAAPDLGIGTLTLYAFSSDNWQRPREEVAALFRLFHRYLRTETARCAANGVRIAVIGRRDRLSKLIAAAIRTAEDATQDATRLCLRIAVDYSARDSILAALPLLATSDAPTREGVQEAIGRAIHAPLPSPPVDLLIRTGGEQRLSDFLLWESAYAELLFTPAMWPEFGRNELESALAEFRRRNRRFGRIEPAPHPVAKVKA